MRFCARGGKPSANAFRSAAAKLARVEVDSERGVNLFSRYKDEGRVRVGREHLLRARAPRDAFQAQRVQSREHDRARGRGDPRPATLRLFRAEEPEHLGVIFGALGYAVKCTSRTPRMRLR